MQDPQNPLDTLTSDLLARLQADAIVVIVCGSKVLSPDLANYSVACPKHNLVDLLEALRAITNEIDERTGGGVPAATLADAFKIRCNVCGKPSHSGSCGL